MSSFSTACSRCAAEMQQTSRRSGTWRNEATNSDQVSDVILQSDITADRIPSSSPPFQFTARDNTPTPATSDFDQSLFEKSNKGSFFRYKAVYDTQWKEWITGKASYKAWVEKLPRGQKGTVLKKGMRWEVAEM
jgi:hypothetical protein